MLDAANSTLTHAPRKRREAGATRNWVGSAVALSADDRMMVVGAHSEDSAARGINGNQANNAR